MVKVKQFSSIILLQLHMTAHLLAYLSSLNTTNLCLVLNTFVPNMKVNILKYILRNNIYDIVGMRTKKKVCSLCIMNIFRKKQNITVTASKSIKGTSSQAIILQWPSLLRYPLTTCLKVESCSSSLKTSCAWSTNPICFANSHRHLPSA